MSSITLKASSSTSIDGNRVSIETSADGSGQKLTQFSLTDSAVKSLYAVGYDANGVLSGPVVGTWTITGGTGVRFLGSNMASSVSLQGLSAGAVTLSFESAFGNKELTVFIEASPTVNFKFANLNYSDYGLLELELELNQAVASEIDVNLATPTGTALAGTHFVAFPSTVKIPAGQSSYKFYTPVIRDYATTTAKNFLLELASANGAILGATFSTTVQIADVDGATVSTPVGEGQIAIGDNYTCWVKNSGLYCWGENNVGQLGNGSTAAFVSTPYMVFAEGSGVTWVSAKSSEGFGDAHTCAVVSGAAYCWGNNTSGQLGINSIVSQTTPQAVLGLGAGVTQISAGNEFSCAVHSGALKCWGNGVSVKGDNFNDYRTPQTYAGFAAGVTSVRTGGGNLIVIRSGAAFAMGRTDFFGYSFAQNNGGSQNTPVLPQQVFGVVAGATEAAIQPGGGCVLVSGGVSCWGYYVDFTLDQPQSIPGFTSDVTHMAVSQLLGTLTFCASFSSGAVNCAVFVSGAGVSSPLTYAISNVAILGATVTSITSGGTSFCATYDTGDNRCWYLAENLLTLVQPKTALPVYLPTNITFDKLVGAGCVFKDREVYCTGANDTQSFSLQSHLGLADFFWGSISEGCLIRDGGLKCWGAGPMLADGVFAASANPVDVVGLASGVTSVVEAADFVDRFRCALKGNQVYCWLPGEIPTLLTGLPSPAKSLASSADIIGAVLESGETRYWAKNRVITSFAGALTNVTQLAFYKLNVFSEVYCFLLSDKTVSCYSGWNLYGQLGDGTTTGKAAPQTVPGLSDVNEIFVSGSSVCARTNTALKCWGNMGSGTSVLIPTTISQVSVVNAKSIFYSGQLCIYDSDSHLVCSAGFGNGVYNRGEFSSRWAQPMPTP